MGAIRGRVVNVRPRGDGTYAVTLVGGVKARSYLWLLADEAPRLGSLLEFEGAELRRFEGTNGKQATITMVEGGKMRLLPDPYHRRFVPPQWLTACSRASWRPLYPHQVEAAGWLAERLAHGNGALLADDPGLGKTSAVLAALVVARALPAIVVCPASLKLNWKREISHLRAELVVHVVDGLRGALPPAHMLIANYDLLRAREGQFRRLGARCIVFDEGHVLKEPTPESTHRAAVATRLAKAVGRCIVMTGTPMPNKPRELWRILHLVSPLEWPSFTDFKRRYCTEPEKDDILVGRQLVTDHGRVHNLDELQARMAPCMLRRLKANVLTALPPKKRRSVLVQLDARDMANYEAAAKDVVGWLRKLGSAERANAAKRGQAVVKLTMLRRIAAMGKLRKAVPRYLEGWFDRKDSPRLVIFGYHQAVLRGVRHICARMGLRMATIAGKDPGDRRQRAIDNFNMGRADVFIAPIKAAGVGLNLQSASDVLFLERLWVPSMMCQAEDRVHRLGQTKEVTITYLDAAATVDEHIATVLAQKQKLIDAVVDDKNAPIQEAMNRETIDAVIASFAAAASS